MPDGAVLRLVQSEAQLKNSCWLVVYLRQYYTDRPRYHQSVAPLPTVSVDHPL